MLGLRPRLAWGQFVAGPTRCWGESLEFCISPEVVQAETISSFRGGQDMREQLLEAIPQGWSTPLALVAPQWMAAFTQLEVLVAARACSNSSSCLFFEVQVAGRLIRVEEDGLVQGCTFQRIRVVVAAGRRWWIDPDPALFVRDWRIWVYGARLLARL